MLGHGPFLVTLLSNCIGSLFVYHRYMLGLIDRKLEKDIHYKDKGEIEKRFDEKYNSLKEDIKEMKEDNIREKEEIKELIQNLSDKLDTNMDKINNHFLNCNARR